MANLLTKRQPKKHWVTLGAGIWNPEHKKESSRISKLQHKSNPVSDPRSSDSVILICSISSIVCLNNNKYATFPTQDQG